MSQAASQVQAGNTISLANVNLTLPSTSVYSTTVTSAGLINGKYVTPVTAVTTAATPTTDATTGVAFLTQGVNKASVIVFGNTAAGVIKMAQGPFVDTAVGVTTVAGAFLFPPQFPNLPDDFCPLAYALVRTAPSSTGFIAGTTSWTATGVTTSAVQNIGALPDRPQTA